MSLKTSVRPTQLCRSLIELNQENADLHLLISVELKSFKLIDDFHKKEMAAETRKVVKLKSRRVR